MHLIILLMLAFASFLIAPEAVGRLFAGDAKSGGVSVVSGTLFSNTSRVGTD